MKATTAKKASLQTELRRLFRSAKLPTSPVLATQIISLSKDRNATAEKFAKVIEMDGALAARLLKMANAPLYAQREPVTSVHRSVTVLGIGRVRTAALGFQLVGHLNRLGNCPFDMKRYWQHSLLRACVAREAAQRVVPELKDEAFLAGLLQDCGVLLLVQLLGADYAALCSSGGLSPAAFYSAEKRQFEFNHVQAIKAMAAEWGLPEFIAVPLAKHHRPTLLGADSGDVERLSAVGHLVGSMCFSSELTVVPSDASLGDYAREQFGMDQGDLLNCTRAAGEAYTQTADLLSESLPEDLDVTDLLGEANRQLTQVAGEAEERATDVEAERDEIRQRQSHLQEALGEYREQAARDPLTGLLNRGALVDAARQCICSARDRGTGLTVMFLDLDNFKKLNDGYGHRAGDEVLIGVAHTIRDTVVNAGCAGRYGGEEFVLVIQGLDEVEAREIAELVVSRVRQIEFPDLQLDGPVTCSLGAVWTGCGRTDAAEDLFAQADALMYQAKRAGKDRCHFTSLDAPTAALAPTATLPTTGSQRAPEPGEQPGSAAGKAAALAVTQALNDVAGDVGTKMVPDQLRRIAERLNRESPKRFVNMRKQQRKGLLSPCVINAFVGTSLEIAGEDAYVRNISTGGIGLLTVRPMSRAEPVEIAIFKQGKPMLYAAGLVAFCRHIEGSVHEVGVQFTAQGKQPIFSHDPAAAIQNFGWLAEALKEKQAGSDSLQ